MSIITVKSVSTEFIKKGKTGYSVATVSYTDNGKEFSKKIMSFTNPTVFAAVKDASPGDNLDVTVTKEGEYYNWTGVKVADATQAAPRQGSTATAPARSAPSTYETADERKIKQLYIVRQSSIANAIEYLSKTAIAHDYGITAVLGVAQEFVDFVYGTDENLAESNPED
jgi:hypothetical protein